MRYIYYDTETTGLNSKTDRIIEIAAYEPLENKTFCSLINPNMPIPKESTAISNITDEMVANAPTFEEAGKKFIEFCEGAVLIAHNNDNFDVHFLRAEFERAQVPMPNWQFIDSLKWAKKYRPDLPRHSLQYLREIYGIEENQAHRALDDVIVLSQVFSKMIDDLSIEKVMDLLNKNDKLKLMPFGKHKGKPLGDVPKSYVSWLNENAVFEKAENSQLKQEFEKLGVL